jgi:hypothetical protein
MRQLEVLEAALSAWRKSKPPRFAAIAEWATARALAEAPRPLLTTGTRRADVEAWQQVFDAGDPLDVPRERKLERLGLGDVSIERPFTSEGVVEVRPSVAEPEVAIEVVASLPEEVGTRLRVLPLEQGPLARFPPPPPEAYLAKLRQVTRLPVEVDWA